MAAQYYHNLRTNLRHHAREKYGVLNKDGNLKNMSWGFWHRKKYLDITNMSAEHKILRAKVLDLKYCALIYVEVPDEEDKEATYVGRAKNQCKS